MDKVIDGHIHIEHQPFNLELIDNMVKVAIEKGINELYILDHTHKFKEFNFLYDNITEEITKSHFSNVGRMSVSEYIDFINLVKSKSWPVKLHFGLEVCFFKESVDELINVLNSLPKFDFLIGSIHFVNGAAVDVSKEIYLKVDVDEFYKEYFNDLEFMIKTKIFTFIAHPDLFKLFGVFPSFDLHPYYVHLAKTLVEYNQETENNSGLVRYGFPYPGLSKELIDVFMEYGVRFHKSSDAHKYQDIGRCFEKIIDSVR